MKLKFVGPKVIISHTGIEFDTNKEDKFVYLGIAIELLLALDHKYVPEKTYTYSPDTKRLNNDEIWNKLRHYCDNLDGIVSDAKKHAEDYVNKKILHAKESHTLNAEEKDVLIKNLLLMKEYIIQRAINKSLYYCSLDTLVTIIKRGHIDYIIAPMFQKFSHVFHSIEGVLKKGRFPIDTKIEIYEEEGKLLVKLDIINR
ncbi:MAG: hypothetical protein U9R50_02700 [Campylobacterota bacterium]|nr:hypothetical protein [Campylobacterota bacterium]